MLISQQRAIQCIRYRTGLCSWLSTSQKRWKLSREAGSWHFSEKLKNRLQRQRSCDPGFFRVWCIKESLHYHFPMWDLYFLYVRHLWHSVLLIAGWVHVFLFINKNISYIICFNYSWYIFLIKSQMYFWPVLMRKRQRRLKASLLLPSAGSHLTEKLISRGANLK